MLHNEEDMIYQNSWKEGLKASELEQQTIPLEVELTATFTSDWFEFRKPVNIDGKQISLPQLN